MTPQDGVVPLDPQLPDPVQAMLSAQSGVVTRGQLAGLGVAPHELARWRRRRLLVSVHPGVYVDHTAEPTWNQRAWAAVLHLQPAALCHESALRAAEGAGRPDSSREAIVHVMVAESRRLVAPAGVRIHRRRDFDDQVLWNLGPPRQRYEGAALDVAIDARDELAAIAVLAAGVQGRRTTALRLLEASRARPRVPHRKWLEGVLADVAAGTCSVLEHGFLSRVERPHGLPRARRQVAEIVGSGRVFRDVDYGPLVVELDGRLHHDTTEARDRDFERDLQAAMVGKTTVRVSWGQVFARPCSTAATLAVILSEHGWRGSPRPCGPACALAGAALAS